jgi:predicted transcriptional regulator
MPKKKKHILDYLDLETYNILIGLEDGYKSFSELFEYSTLSRPNFNNRLTQLIELKLIKEVFVSVKRRRKKKYGITKKGKRILSKMREVEEIYYK